MGVREWVLKGGGSPGAAGPKPVPRTGVWGGARCMETGRNLPPRARGGKGPLVSPRLLDPRVTGQYLGPAPSK